MSLKDHKDFLKNEYDWSSESQSFQTEAQNVFGSNWKQEEAKAISWDGLGITSGYLPYRNNYNGLQYLYITTIKTKIQNTNKNCP